MIHDRFLLPLLLAAPGLLGPAAAQTPLVRAGSNWRYLDDGSDQGTAWRAPAFDDSSWSLGNAQLGYGDGDEETVLSFGPDPSDKYITYYFRSRFNVQDPSVFTSLALDLLRDDGAVVYLNGVEVLRDNMPGGSIDYLTEASGAVGGNAESTFYPFGLDPALLVVGSNTIAIELHQAGPTSSDVSLDVELVGLTTVVTTRGAYLQLGTPNGIRVRWNTLPATDGRVWYGTRLGALTSVASEPEVVTAHEVELVGLQPATRYYYAYGSGAGELGGGDDEHSFVTPPLSGSEDPLRIWVLGDSGTAGSDVRAVRDAYEAYTGSEYTNAWIMLGDNAYGSGTEQEYQAAVFNVFASMLRRSPLWPARGNHDTFLPVYQDLFTLPAAGEAGGVPSGTESYYSFDLGNVHFVCLDSEGSDRSVGAAMWTWCDADLAATSQPWIVAYWHHPPYSKGTHDSDYETRLIEMRENFLPLLEDHGVDLALAGHSHVYERSYLLDGHYDVSSTLTPAMKVDGGDGREGGDGAYNKAAGPRAGAVYITAGSSGSAGKGELDHPAMFHSVSTLGSVVLDVAGGRLDATFLDATGGIEDHFTLLNDTYSGTFCEPSVNSQSCEARVETSGAPSATSATPFLLTANDLPFKAAGFLAYSLAPTNVPLFGGRACVGRPFGRVPAAASGSFDEACGGRLQLDFNAHVQGGSDPSLSAGTTVYAQFWYRDTGVHAIGLSEALQFTIEP